MKPSQRSTLVHGVVGGLLAGAAVALWFFVVDLFAGDPLRTPYELGLALFGPSSSGAVGPTVGLYTLLHFGTFAIVGGTTAVFLGAVGLAPRVALGLFVGVVVFTAIHYVGLLVTGTQLLAVLPAIHVVGANLLAGVLLMSYLHRSEHEEKPFGWTALIEHPLLTEGIQAGLIGAGTVAAWFLVLDILRGSPFMTPAALGSMLFLGADGPESVAVTGPIVAAYTVTHVVLFALAGMVFAAIARGTERVPSIAFFVVMGGLLLEALSFSVLVSVGTWVLGSVSIWAVGVANLLAVVAMGGWLLRQHPTLREVLLEAPAGA